jgi:hypothetical protein
MTKLTPPRSRRRSIGLFAIFCSTFWLSLSLRTPAFAESFAVQTLNNKVVWWPSLGIAPNDDAYVAYYFVQGSSYGVNCAHRQGGVWTDEPVTGAIAWYLSLALDPAGNPHVAYYESVGPIPRYASRVNGAWVVEPIDIAGESDSQGATSLAFDANGQAHVVYPWRGILKHATRAQGQWIYEVIDPNLGAGDPGTSLAISAAGVLWVSYHRGPTVLCAHRVDGVWSIDPVNTSVGADPYTTTSLALDAEGDPMIAYFGESQLHLVSQSLGRWQAEVVAGAAGFVASLALDATSSPHVSYCDSGALKYAERSGEAWILTTIDMDPSSGTYSSLAINHNGTPEIAYKFKARYSGPGALRYAIGQEATSVLDPQAAPAAIALDLLAPNPAHGGPATVAFSLPKSDAVTLALYDTAGRCVATRPSQAMTAGSHELTWDAHLHASGVYFLRLATESGTSIERPWVILR